MISMGKPGGAYGSGNTGLPQAFSGGKKTQNNQKSIFGAKNKSSVTDIRRMLARDGRNGQMQAANSWTQDSIVTSSLSYSESLRDQRQQTKNTTLALKKLKYQFKSISSKILRSKTSQAAKQAAGQGAAHGTLFVADRQSAGKGRRGRSWESPAGTGIWMSLLLRPDMSPESASMLTLVLAIAMVEAIREEVKDIDCYIKWPNDIVVNGKKITGILTEMSAEMDLIHYVVIGIGINVNTTEFDEAIRDMATSLYLETHRKIKRSNIIAAFSRSFDKYYHEFLKTNDLSLLVDKYNELLINKDRTVRAIYEKEELIATAIGINKEGELIVKDEAGKEIAIRAGEVSVRGLYGYV